MVGGREIERVEAEAEIYSRQAGVVGQTDRLHATRRGEVFDAGEREIGGGARAEEVQAEGVVAAVEIETRIHRGYARIGIDRHLIVAAAAYDGLDAVDGDRRGVAQCHGVRARTTVNVLGLAYADV